MTRLAAVALLSSLIALSTSCIGGSVVDPDTTVQTYDLKLDATKGLLFQACLDQFKHESHPEESCTPYPNGLECQRAQIAVKADGRTHFTCWDEQNKIVMADFAALPTIPIMCKANAELSCQTCVDMYGNTILDNCNHAAQNFRQAGMGWSNAPEGTAFLSEGPGTPTAPQPPSTTPPTQPGTTPQPPAPPPAGGEACKAGNAILLYATELNKLLAHEGLNFTWAPNLAGFANPKDGFFGYGANTSAHSCQAFLASIADKLKHCISGSGANCKYCWQVGGKKTCKCYRVNVAAMKNACSQIPANCDQQAWSASLIMAYGIGTKWLFTPSYQQFYGQAQVAPNAVPLFPKCEGSPLVLDLGDDGVAPTSVEAGAEFDLLGVGPLQTAWVRGNDALLALDRNGNGRIDSGAELFGEATAGRPHLDGFDALAELDSNHDGKVDARDAQWSKLVLWTDTNGDGVSQTGELHSLAAKGVASISLRKTTKAQTRDRHGNDLSLQGSFARTDGTRGLMVDVFFQAR